MKIDQNVIDVLTQAIIVDNTLKLVGNIDRKLYIKVNSVLESIGGKWNRKNKLHVFDNHDIANLIDDICHSGEYESLKNDFDFYPTPKAVVDKMLELVSFVDGDLVLEPSAGTGNIANEIANKYNVLVDVIELNSRNFDALSKNEKFNSAIHGDFLTMRPDKKYNKIIMNPPFTKKADIDHVIHALEFLIPGGQLVAIMSAGVVNSSTKKAKTFLSVLDSMSRYDIMNLPANSFKESGTCVSTILLNVNK